MMRRIRIALVAGCALLGLLVVALWLRSFGYYNAFHACVGDTLVELKCSGGVVVIEWASPWPVPEAVVTTWERWGIAEYAIPDIRVEGARLGFGFERKSTLVLSGEMAPTTNPEDAESAPQKMIPVQTNAVQLPMWAVAGLLLLPATMWIQDRITARRSRAASPADAPPASGCPPEEPHPPGAGRS